MSDVLQEFKSRQRAGWASFAALESLTIPPAARLVRFAGVRPGQSVLDVGCGTGVVAVTARREGARVTGLDLTPELLERARAHGAVAGYGDIVWREGDAEAMPFRDGEFDVVLSQYGHMFAPRPEVALREMLRVLRPGGTIAFATWPPEHGMGAIFAAVARHAPPPPGVSPPWLWGDVAVVKERLGTVVRDVAFDRHTVVWSAMSPGHHFELLRETSGPVINVVKALQHDPERLARFRGEIEAIVGRYFDAARNEVHLDSLLTRGIKA